MLRRKLRDFMGRGACADFAFHDEAEMRRKLAFLSSRLFA